MLSPALNGDLKPLEESLSLPLRPPETVMRLERLGSFHSSRLSFTRTLVRRMHRENWRFEVIRNTLDVEGYGSFVYLIQTPKGPVSFVAFATQIDDSDRTDRVIAEKWDMCFTLFNGMVTDTDVERLSVELPLQEAGRLTEREIVMSRANKSVRLFNSVVNQLAKGRQPDARDIMKIGYLVRTTAVYGNGKFGAMDFDQVKEYSPFSLPFQAEMLTVYMARQFSIDLVEHVARQRNPQKAVSLSKELKRSIGVGNATGLGMAPFLVGHPQLIGQWMKVRETAISMTKSKCEVPDHKFERFAELVERVRAHLQQWITDDERQADRLVNLRNELKQLTQLIPQLNDIESPWVYLSHWANSNASFEFQELLNSLILEIYPDEVNELEHLMGVDEFFRLNPAMEILELRTQIEQRYKWALSVDYDEPDSQFYFWYVSQEKEEPRLGRRHSEPGGELEMRVGIGRDVSALYDTVCTLENSSRMASVADLLCQFPQHRNAVSRVQSLENFEYGEIQDNLLGKECEPIDLLRCKLAIFGATRFDPKSNLWTRITLFQGAPLYDEITAGTADDWAFPVVQINSQ